MTMIRTANINTKTVPSMMSPVEYLLEGGMIRTGGEGEEEEEDTVSTGVITDWNGVRGSEGRGANKSKEGGAGA